MCPSWAHSHPQGRQYRGPPGPGNLREAAKAGDKLCWFIKPPWASWTVSGQAGTAGDRTAFSPLWTGWRPSLMWRTRRTGGKFRPRELWPGKPGAITLSCVLWWTRRGVWWRWSPSTLMRTWRLQREPERPKRPGRRRPPAGATGKPARCGPWGLCRSLVARPRATNRGLHRNKERAVRPGKRGANFYEYVRNRGPYLRSALRHGAAGPCQRLL